MVDNVHRCIHVSDPVPIHVLSRTELHWFMVLNPPFSLCVSVAVHSSSTLTWR